mmetsp:Transcript_20432/g.38863  ORF Transcript_20432/g.38863 Transcript_20432/m.38863 type:complete len:537 (+) Transcript_20432:277-1887(+)|eukprot:CAMPEP_0114254420 /NCGR_PEP_ID=MMETSP0058-20121206/16967_1 /TAXON_ID=36894 /ORGANISM="Pyramimonas parkeae, CCMP726" /LENGTH=536 /DNA_ID=CAMNT_0001368633 /DNA_START=270 /DNA_END=1880 /DNA_ORIENTATION=+
MDSVHARLVEALPPQLHPLPSESAAGADVWGDCGDLEPADLHSAKKVGHDNLRSAIQVLSARPVLGLKLRKSDSLIRLISNEISNHTKRARNACANTQDSLETASSDHEDGGVPSSRQSASPAWDCSSGTGSEGSSPKRARREASQDPSLVVASGVGSAATAEANACKWKASNFPAVSLRIGGWERTSQYMGDLVSKVYFAKRKLVWEILEGGLKSKVEVQWADISALQASFPDNGPSVLEFAVVRSPLFFRETDPQPRKHTIWHAASDFTCGEASMCRPHRLVAAPGIMMRHWNKLLACDARLRALAEQAPTPLRMDGFSLGLPSTVSSPANLLDLGSELDSSKFSESGDSFYKQQDHLDGGANIFLEASGSHDMECHLLQSELQQHALSQRELMQLHLQQNSQLGSQLGEQALWSSFPPIYPPQNGILDKTSSTFLADIGTGDNSNLSATAGFSESCTYAQEPERDIELTSPGQVGVQQELRSLLQLVNVDLHRMEKEMVDAEGGGMMHESNLMCKGNVSCFNTWGHGGTEYSI